MEFKEFIEAVREVVVEKSGKRAEIRMVSKNNDTKLHALIIQDEQSNIAPTIYLEPFWDIYKNTGCMRTVIEKIMQAYERGYVANIDMNWFMQWESVKDKVAYKLINFEENRELLVNIPYVKYLDLAKVYYVIFENETLGKGTILIHNNHLDMWGVSSSELSSVAVENTVRKLPVSKMTLGDILREKGMDIEYEDCNDNRMEQFLVLSNKDKCLGAATICYKDVIKGVAEDMQSDLIIIPSSIHECLIGKLDYESDLETFKYMVKDVNSSVVMPEEKLSDSVYVYRREKDEIEIV